MESQMIKELLLSGCPSKEPSPLMTIGTILPEPSSPVSMLKFDRVNPAPDMTKRITALKLITKGSWPPTR